MDNYGHAAIMGICPRQAPPPSAENLPKVNHETHETSDDRKMDERKMAKKNMNFIFLSCIFLSSLFPDRRRVRWFGPHEPISSQFLPFLYLIYWLHPREWKRLLFPQFFESDNDRYLSRGDGIPSYLWCKMARKTRQISYRANTGKNPPAVVYSLALAKRRKKGRALAFGPHRCGPRERLPPALITTLPTASTAFIVWVASKVA